MILRSRALTSLAILGVATAISAQGCASAATGESTEAVSAAIDIDVAQSVLTQHNDNARTGAYLNETTLTPNLLKSGHFGRLYTRRVDGPAAGMPHDNGQIAAQPLYVHGIKIDGVPKNLLLVATRNNMVYAFDADSTDPSPTGGIVWGPVQLTEEIAGPIPRARGASEVEGFDLRANSDGRTGLCGQTHGPVGITATPVIDVARGTMYVVARTGDTPTSDNPEWNSSYSIYEIQLVDGKLARTPVKIALDLPNDPGHSFDADKALNRPGLLLLNNTLYIGFGAIICDDGGGKKDSGTEPHGWVFAYDVSTSMITKKKTWNSSDVVGLGSIWQSGNGLASDGTSVYFLTGNSPSGQLTNIAEYGESMVSLTLVQSESGAYDYKVARFRPSEFRQLDSGRRDWRGGTQDTGGFEKDREGPRYGGDTDLSSGGVLMIAPGVALGGGKQGMLYLVDTNKMATAPSPPSLPTPPANVPTYAQFGIPNDDSGLIQRLQAFHNTWHPEIADVALHPDVLPPDDDLGLSQIYGPNIHGSPILWNGPKGPTVYAMPEKDYLRAYPYTGGRLGTTPMVSKVRSPDGMPGAVLSLSANQGNSGSGIIWASMPRYDSVYVFAPGDLVAFDAETLDELWRDSDPNEVAYAKFTPPTIADGKVFRPTFGGEIIVYGQRNEPAPSTCASLDDKFLLAGGESALGTLQSQVGDTRYYARTTQDHANVTKHLSAVVWSPDHCAHVIGEKFYNAWNGGTVLGAPLADEERTAEDRTSLNERFQRFANGTIYLKDMFGAHVVSGAVLSTYLAAGGPAVVGFPMTDLAYDSALGLVVQKFEHAWIQRSLFGAPSVVMRSAWWTDFPSLPAAHKSISLNDANFESNDSWALAGEEASQACRNAGYLGGQVTGDHVPNKVGVVCYGDGARLFRSNYSTRSWTIPNLITNDSGWKSVQWGLANRMAQEFCSRNGYVGGLYQGDGDVADPKLAAAGMAQNSGDRTIVCFTSKNAEVVQVAGPIAEVPGFDVNTTPWQVAARAAQHLCNSPAYGNYPGGRFNGHQVTANLRTTRGLLCYR